MSGPTADGKTVHATLVAKAGNGVLLRGRSGAGKSDLAFRLMSLNDGWQLVSDDQVMLSRHGAAVAGRAPPAIAGKLELRGIGIVEVPIALSAHVRLVVDLVPHGDVPRLPGSSDSVELLGVSLPSVKLNGLEASAPQKIALLLSRIDKK